MRVCSGVSIRTYDFLGCLGSRNRFNLLFHFPFDFNTRSILVSIHVLGHTNKTTLAFRTAGTFSFWHFFLRVSNGYRYDIKIGLSKLWVHF